MGCCAVSGSREEDWNLIKVKKTKRRISENKNIDIRKNYDFISTLGNGAFGKVRLYRDKNNKNLLYAIKTLKKSGISDFEFDLIKNETEILSNMDHPNIVKYFGVYEDEYHIHILMEYLKGMIYQK
jgi:serine/threonine protein kinase